METGLTKKEFLSKIFKDAGCVADDFFKHKHYTIITRSGIEKIQAHNDIKVDYTLERCEPNFCVVKALCNMGGKEVQTYGSALKGATHNEGSTNTWYVAEMAEKRAFSRGVLKVMGLYEHGIMGDDESEEFQKPKKA
jgi:hypothetical protein